MKHIFVCGCPRSGTSAATLWLNRSASIVIGLERYQKFWKERSAFPTGAFERDRFFDVQDGDTWYPSLTQFDEHYADIDRKWSNATLVGDKIPSLWTDFSRVCESFPGAKILFTYRDPFAVALSYKKRSLNENDATWGRARDVSCAVREWNASTRAFLDFADSNVRSRTGSSALVLEYGHFVSNALDRRLLARFLRGVDDLPKVERTPVRPLKHDDVQLSETERDLVWSMVDFGLAKRMDDVLTKQPWIDSRTTAASNGTGRREWYHAEDSNLAGMNYGEFRVPRCTYVFRGRRTEFDSTSPYAVCLGSATTFGRLISASYPEQLETTTGIPFLNLGIGGGKPEAYLTNDAIMSLVERSGLAIIELMSARGLPSPIFRPNAFDGNMGTFVDTYGIARFRREDPLVEWILSKSESGQLVFVDRAYEIALRHLTGAERREVQDVLVARYVRDWLALAGSARNGALGVVISQTDRSRQRPVASPATFDEWCGGYPHFIDTFVVERIRAAGIPIVSATSSRGFPFRVMRADTGEPAALFPWQPDPSLNTYYPSQEMQNDTTAALLDHPSVTSFISRLRGAVR